MNRRLIIVTLFLCAAPVAAQSVTPFVPGMVVTQTTRITPGFYEVPGRRSLDDALIVDEWGPYDGRSPKLWPLDTVSAPVDLRVLGPPGRWRVVEGAGVAGLSADSGSVGHVIHVESTETDYGKWPVELEYVDEETVSPRGTRRPAGEPVRFSFERFNPVASGGGWDVGFYTWTDPEADPDKSPERFAALLSGEPMLRRSEVRLDVIRGSSRSTGSAGPH